MHPVRNDDELYFIADAPHLTKNLRAAFAKQTIYFPDWVVKEENLPTNFASMAHVRALHEFQKNLVVKPCPTLKIEDIDCTHFVKMDVGSALHIFNHSVAAGLRFLVTERNYPKSFLTTAYFLENVRKWFDLMSNRSPKMALGKKNPQKYEETTSFLKRFAMIMCQSKIGEKGEWKPVHTGFQLTTEAILKLVEYLLDQGFDYVLTARFNQDKLENLFSQVRSRSKTPTPIEFKNALKIVTISQYMHQNQNGSYENDDSSYIADFLKVNPNAKLNLQETELDQDYLFDLIESVDMSLVKSPENEVLYNLVGYILHSVEKTKQIKCKNCLSSLIATEKTSIQSLTDYRDFTGHSLKRCSEQIFFEFFLPMEKLFLTLEQSSKDFVTELNMKNHILNHLGKQLPDPFSSCSCKTTKDKLIARYVTFRMKIAHKSLATDIREKVKQSGKKGELGSRSATMKKVVNTIN